MVSTLKVNTIKKQSGSSITIAENGDTITITTGATVSGGTVASTIASQSITAKGDGVSADGKITLNCHVNTHGVSIQAPPHSAGQSYNLILPTSVGTNGQVLATNGSNTNQLTWIDATETKPTITGINPNVAENTQTQITITGTNFVNTPYVDAINSTGAITSADSVSFSSATTLVTNFTLPVDGTYFIRVENPDGNAVRSSSAILTVSDAPAWQTAAGSLGTVDAGETINFTVNATNATAYAVQSGSLPGGASLNTSTGAITGTESGATQDTTYNFTIRATDAQAQTADRAFSIAVNVGISNGMRFDP
tara:strand:- start:1284 stop:2210 length:927 start_codon:yes stop_codon:yes gene_type:complete